MDSAPPSTESEIPSVETRETSANQWLLVSAAAGDAVVVAFDGCHKIYLALDERQANFFRGSEFFETEAVGDPEVAVARIREWYDQSCPLRFVESIATSPEDGSEVIVALVRQSGS